jgi:hypothetical protein
LDLNGRTAYKYMKDLEATWWVVIILLLMHSHTIS